MEREGEVMGWWGERGGSQIEKKKEVQEGTEREKERTLVSRKRLMAGEKAKEVEKKVNSNTD